MHKRFCNQRGFTLPELLVVIAIIGILSTIGYAYFANAKAQARDRVRAANLEQLGLAIEAYKDKHGRYPASGCSVTLGTTVNAQWSGSETYPGEGLFILGCSDYILGLVSEGFIPSLPKESPAQQAKGYLYRTNTDGTRFKILLRNGVEVLTVTSYDHPLARYPKSSCVGAGNPPFPASQAKYYAIYSDEISACW